MTKHHSAVTPSPPSWSLQASARHFRELHAINCRLTAHITALEADEILALHTRMETPNRPAILKRFCHPGSKDIVAYPSTQNLLSAAHLQKQWR